MQNTLYVPHDARFVRLRTPKQNEQRYYDPDKRQDPFIPGEQVDLQMALVQKMASSDGLLKLKSDGHEVAIGSGGLQSKRAALFSLILGHRELLQVV
jgi:hypothetical protein